MRGERSGKIAWNGLNNQEFRSFLEATMAVCAVAKCSSCTRRYIQLHSPVLETPPLAYVKESLYNSPSAQGLIISRAF
jgi:hypothetical protein